MTEARVPVTVEVTADDRKRAWPHRHRSISYTDMSGWEAGRFDDEDIIQDIARARLAGVAAGREEGRAEIVRLRGLLVDPGNPAWEDARAVLVAELRKAELPDHAAQVADGQGAYVPSWIALNLIAHAAKSAAIRQMGGE